MADLTPSGFARSAATPADRRGGPARLNEASSPRKNLRALAKGDECRSGRANLRSLRLFAAEGVRADAGAYPRAATAFLEPLQARLVCRTPSRKVMQRIFRVFAKHPPGGCASCRRVDPRRHGSTRPRKGVNAFRERVDESGERVADFLEDLPDDLPRLSRRTTRDTIRLHR